VRTGLRKMENHKPLTASVRFEFTVNLKAVQLRIVRTSRQPVPRLCRTLVRAHQLKHLLKSRQFSSVEKLAKWLNLTYGRVSQIMSLLYLAPDIQEQILCSEEPWTHQLIENDVRGITQELLWERQKKVWNSLTARQNAAN
jgi:hypothetical protein